MNDASSFGLSAPSGQAGGGALNWRVTYRICFFLQFETFKAVLSDRPPWVMSGGPPWREAIGWKALKATVHRDAEEGGRCRKTGR
jgi:hypothetical protein